MSELYLPGRRIIKLELQPNFPQEDLNINNAAMLEFQLQTEEGLTAYAEQLQHHQRYIHLIADMALKSLGISTRYAEEELRAFSHGFASFETISDLVHPPRLYDTTIARLRVEQLLISTHDYFETELEEFQQSLDDKELPSSPVDPDRITPQKLHPLETDLEMLTRLLADSRRIAPIEHDRPDPEQALAKRHGILPEKYPNVYGVIIKLGEAQEESMAQLHARTSGAQLAYDFQSQDLDA